MRTIYALTDYKNRYLSKFGSIPYRSGMDKKLLSKYFTHLNYDIKFIKFNDIDFRQKDFRNEIILYTSSEDVGYHYKNYIEDIVYGLKLMGAFLIPDYRFLKANNNKILMEILRDLSKDENLKSLKSIYIGTYEDLEENQNEINQWNNFVVKPAEGAMSKGIKLAKNKVELKKIVRKKSRTYHIIDEIKDIIRKLYFRGYQKESRYRKKLVIQKFIPNLKNDWKILIYWDKIFVLTRYNRKNDFRASGSGNFVFERDLPEGLLDFSYNIFIKLNVPSISLDVCFDGNNFYIIEFQGIHFGTTTIVKSPFYYIKTKSSFKKIEERSILEKVYAESIVSYIQSKDI